MNQRRLLVLAIGAGLAGHATLLRAQTSAGTVRRVGVLAPSSRAKEEVTLKPFFDEMRQLGWVEGRNIAYDRAYADDQHQALPKLAAELVARGPDLIYTPPEAAALAAKRATNVIPIVFATGTDPVGAGLVMSHANPGGNATGIISNFDSLAPKRLELLREAMPGVKRLGLIGNPDDPRLKGDTTALARVAPALGVTIIVAEAASPAGFDAAVASLIGQRVDAITMSGSIATNLRERLVELTMRQRVPVTSGAGELADAGALLVYGSPLPTQFRRSAHLVDKVLKGAKPADIPVEQPTTFDLVINMKTARVLGITIPQSIVLRAVRVIE